MPQNPAQKLPLLRAPSEQCDIFKLHILEPPICHVLSHQIVQDAKKYITANGLCAL